MMIHPTDALVSRLLQQQSRQSSASVSAGDSSRASTDVVNISSQAREQQQLPQGQTNMYGQKQERLESQLIGLYTKHDKHGRQD